MSEAHDTPLATYTERLPQVRRRFFLYADCVEVEAVWTLGRTHRSTVPLASLTTPPARRVVRNRWFKNSLLIASLAVAAALVLGRESYAPEVQRVARFGWAIAAGCVVVMAVSFRRRQFALFQKKAGGVGLDLCDAGPDRARFEAFVREIQKAIRNA